MILGMDVSHGSPGRSDIPSVAAVRLFLFCFPPIFVVVFVKRNHNTIFALHHNLFLFFVISAAYYSGL